MAIFRRTSDVVYSRLNLSIISVSNISAPVPYNITPSDFFAALENFFGGDIATGAYFDPVTANAVFLGILSSALTDSSIGLAVSDGLGILRGLLTLPLIFFQPTWLGSNAPGYNDTTVTAGLPPDVYISVSLSQSHIHVLIPRWTIILYISTLLTIYICCVVCLSTSLFIQPPHTTSYEIFDFASMVCVPTAADASAAQLLSGLRTKGSVVLRKELKNEAIFIRDITLRGQATAAPDAEQHEPVTVTGITVRK